MSKDKYFDRDGNEVSLYQLVRKEPEWAENRIRVSRKAIEAMENISEECRMNALIDTQKCCSKICKILDNYDKE